MRPAQGYARHGHRRVVVSFDTETFGQIQTMALRDRVSFGEKVRQLVEWGMMEVSNAA